MKLIIHASLFASGSVEVDTETGEHRFITEPLITADQGISAVNGEKFDPKDAMMSGACALAVLNQAASKWVLRSAGLEAKGEKLGAIPLVNVVGKGSA